MCNKLKNENLHIYQSIKRKRPVKYNYFVSFFSVVFTTAQKRKNKYPTRFHQIPSMHIRKQAYVNKQWSTRAQKTVTETFLYIYLILSTDKNGPPRPALSKKARRSYTNALTYLLHTQIRLSYKYETKKRNRASFSALFFTCASELQSSNREN